MSLSREESYFRIYLWGSRQWSVRSQLEKDLGVRVDEVQVHLSIWVVIVLNVFLFRTGFSLSKIGFSLDSGVVRHN